MKLCQNPLQNLGRWLNQHKKPPRRAFRPGKTNTNRLPRLAKTPTGYAASHCTQCAGGWTRTMISGKEITVCLLDCEPVLADMTSCDRYEAKEANKA